MDINPTNVVIDTKTDKLYVIDFSLAIQLKFGSSTTTGYCGTKGYIAPEVYMKKSYNPSRQTCGQLGQR
jgi:serine/threonine protein kinase